MPTLSVVPLVLTVPNFLATQVVSKSHISFLSLSFFLSFFHLWQPRWIHNLTFYFLFFLSFFFSFFLSSLATQVASKSHISCLPFFFHLWQLRWPHGLTTTTGQTSPCTFSRLVDQQISLSHFTSVVSKRFLKCEKKQPGKLGKIPPSTNDYHLLSSVEQPGTCPKRSAVQTQLLVLWGNPKGDCNPGFWYMNNAVWGHAYTQRYENSEEYIA